MQAVCNLVRALLALGCTSVLLSGCSDENPAEPTTPTNRFWSEVVLPTSLPSASLFDVSFQGDRGLAVGVTTSGNVGLLLERDTAGWTRNPVIGLETAIVTGVAMDAWGHGVMVGFSPNGKALIMAERPDWTTVFPDSAPGDVLRAIAADGAGTFVCTGSLNSAITAWSGTAEGEWSRLSVSSPGEPQEKALVDVAQGAGLWAACGFDDGGDGSANQPRSLFMVDDGTGWKLITAPCGGCSNQGYRTVAVSSSGTVYLAGAVTDFSAGAGNQHSAFLRSYSPDLEEWTEIVLPQSTLLGRVNDILLGSNGDIYLACGVDNIQGFLVHLPSGGSSSDPLNIEWRDLDTRLEGLGQAGDGAVHAVGSRLRGGAVVPLMLRREL